MNMIPSVDDIPETSGDRGSWARDLIERVHLKEIRRHDAMWLWPLMDVKVRSSRRGPAVSVTLPVHPDDVGRVGASRPVTRVNHVQSGDPTMERASVARVVRAIRHLSFLETRRREIDPEDMADDEVPFEERRCPGVMTRLLRSSGVNLEGMGRDIEGGYGWKAGEDQMLPHDFALEGLPAALPPLSFQVEPDEITDFRVRLGRDVFLRGNRLTLLDMTLPDTHLVGMIGKHVSAIVRHEVLDDPTLIIRSARQTQAGTTITVDMSGDWDIVAGYEHFLAPVTIADKNLGEFKVSQKRT